MSNVRGHFADTIRLIEAGALSSRRPSLLLLVALSLASHIPTRRAPHALAPRASMGDRSRRGAIVDRPLVVLFCGLEFHQGFACTKRRCDALNAASGSAGIEVVACARSEVAARIADADIAVPLMTRLDDAILGAATRLRLVLQFGVGLEGVDEAACTRRGIALARVPSQHTGNADSTAEMAVFLLLASMRRVNEMADSIRDRTLGSPWGRSLVGARVHIVGWGDIARKIARRLAPFGCELSASRARDPDGTWRRRRDGRATSARSLRTASDGAPEPPDRPEPEPEPDDDDPTEALVPNRGVGREDTLAAIAECDAFVLACAQTPANRGMVDAAFLDAAKPGAVCVNVARGGLFDRDAVLAALNDGRLGYLASDVAWAEPLDPSDAVARHPRAYFTPHVGGVTESSYETMAAIVAEEAARARRGEGCSDRVSVVNGGEI